jgi:hypothetical protein
MSKSQGRTEEKTAKQVIPDEELIRLLRIDLKSGIYPSQQATAAVLRSLDAANLELAAANTSLKNIIEGPTLPDEGTDGTSTV